MSRAATATAELVRMHLRTLKMPGLARGCEALARQAREERWSFEEFLYEAVALEVASRSASAGRQRLQAARFPELKRCRGGQPRACSLRDSAGGTYLLAARPVWRRRHGPLLPSESRMIASHHWT
jgi:hypothetical protein